MSEDVKEKIYAVQVQKGGRIQIPKDLRDEKDIRDGDYVVLNLKKAVIREIEEAMGVR